MRLGPLLRPGQAFREEPSGRLAAAPWLLLAGGLAVVAVGAAFGLGALKAIGVIAAFIGGGLYVAIGVRAATRLSERQPTKSTPNTGDDSPTSG